MTNRFLILALMLFTIAPLSSARAQLCATLPAVIFEMTEPELGAYNLWDTVYGTPDTHETFSAAVFAPKERSLFVVGEFRTYPGARPKLITAQIDHRGRAKWDKTHTIKRLKHVKAVTLATKGFAVLASRRRADHPRKDEVWIGFFNTNGHLTGQKTIALPSASLSAKDMVATDNNQFLIAATAHPPSSIPHSLLYKIDQKGEILQERAYVTGNENTMNSLKALPEGGFLTGGTITNEDGRKTGWITHLNNDASLVWEHHYPRGHAAIINHITDFTDGTAITAGYSVPAGRGYKAAWIMRINKDNGTVMWQRYYTGPRHYEAIGTITDETGLFTAVINGEKAENTPSVTDFVRILTLNLRGVVFGSEDHFNSEGAAASKVLLGNKNERAIIGHSQVKEAVEDGDGNIASYKRSRDGWVVTAPPLDPYDDPCEQAPLYNP